ncbi:HTH-type transcriptional activator Btr [Stieleria neptunia]|uniref:HTH-type transcriptional activator Btr n=1 Tax=Stieleria neptunia TaxID=2527979 RepID=A0A518HW91_9BACT|nr:AraC family transcriptional regulator [Stieleria neptunia]QDV45093.1 HTH-type transcriptional activator Btr [Stieleria neptunia]
MSFFSEDPITVLLEKLYLPDWEAVEFSFPNRWGLRVPDKVVSMYVFTQGGGWLQCDQPGTEPIKVIAGDHVITTQGQAHRMLRELDCDAEPIGDRIRDPTWQMDSDVGQTVFVYAQFSLSELTLNPLGIGLPDVLHLNHRRDNVLKSCVPMLDLLQATRREATAGWQLTVRRLAELVFVRTIAAELNRGVPITNTQSDMHIRQAMTDPAIGPVLKQMLTSPQRPWSVPQMARIAKISKSAFSERFRNCVGSPPLQYLTEIRMNKACRLLRESTVEIANIAILVGYESPSSFSNAFKRWSGKSPVGYRRGGEHHTGCQPKSQLNSLPCVSSERLFGNAIRPSKSSH